MSKINKLVKDISEASDFAQSESYSLFRDKILDDLISSVEKIQKDWEQQEIDLKAHKPGVTQRTVDAAKKAYEVVKDIYHQHPTASKIAAGALAAGGAALAARKLLRRK